MHKEFVNISLTQNGALLLSQASKRFGVLFYLVSLILINKLSSYWRCSLEIRSKDRLPFLWVTVLFVYKNDADSLINDDINKCSNVWAYRKRKATK